MSRTSVQRQNNYNIPRKIRELQFPLRVMISMIDYNIPRKIRELQFYV